MLTYKFAKNYMIWDSLLELKNAKIDKTKSII